MTDRSPRAAENARARSRARQRARGRIATHYRAEVNAEKPRLWSADVTASGVEQRAVRLVASRHPRMWRKYLTEETEREGYIPMSRGSAPIYPHGTKQAWMRHHRNGEDPCGDCENWHTTRFGTEVCLICDKKFDRAMPAQVYCDRDCYELMAGYFRYYLQWAEARVRQARYVLRSPDEYPEYQVRYAKRIIKEHRETGTVRRRRTISHFAPKATAIAEAKNLDLDEVLRRLERTQ